MTREEFLNEYSKLEKNYGTQNFGRDRGVLLFNQIQDLPVSWLRQIVERILLENNPRFNFLEAVKSEKNAKLSVDRSSEVFAEISRRVESERGLENALKAFGAKSLLEAIQKKTNQCG